MDVKSYRPISLVSVFSKIFQKLVYNNVVNSMNKYNLLYKLQFGFRKEHSTQHALITLVDNITKALDEGSMLIGVFLDLKISFRLYRSQYTFS